MAIENGLREILLNGTANRQTIIHFPNGEYDDITGGIYSGSMTIEEILSESGELTFGECNASRFEATLFDVEDISNTMIYVYQKIPFDESKSKILITHSGKEILTHSNNNILLGRSSDYAVPLFYGRVDSAELQTDKIHRKITAYDELYFQGDTNCAEWYSTFFSDGTNRTLKDFRNSLFDFIGVEQEDIVLVNDNIVIEETLSTTSLKFSDIIKAICQINGVFGHIDRKGIFRYVDLSNLSDVYNVSDNYRSNNTTYESYVVKKIDKLQIRSEEDDMGAIVGNGNNPYIIQGNFLLYGKTASELESIATSILNKVCDIEYRPIDTTLIFSEPYISVGSGLAIMTNRDNVVINTIVLKNTLSGTQLFNQNIISEGNEYRDEVVDDVNAEINQLKGKTLKIIKDVDMYSVQISDLKVGYAQLQLEAGRISLAVGDKVDKGDVTNQLSLEKDQISIVGNRLVIDATNFQLSANGAVECSDITITGGVINVSSTKNLDFITLTNTTNSTSTVIKTTGFNIGSSDAYLNATYGSLSCVFGDYEYELTPTSLSMSGADGDYFSITSTSAWLSVSQNAAVSCRQLSVDATKGVYLNSSSNISIDMSGNNGSLDISTDGTLSPLTIKTKGSNSDLKISSEASLILSSTGLTTITADTDISINATEDISIDGNKIIVGSATSKIGFLGNAAKGAQEVTSVPAAPTLADLRDSVRDIYNALSVFGLVDIV